jgi:hypothetical protein
MSELPRSLPFLEGLFPPESYSSFGGQIPLEGGFGEQPEAMEMTSMPGWQSVYQPVEFTFPSEAGEYYCEDWAQSLIQIADQSPSGSAPASLNVTFSSRIVFSSLSNRSLVSTRRSHRRWTASSTHFISPIHLNPCLALILGDLLSQLLAFMDVQLHLGIFTSVKDMKLSNISALTKPVMNQALGL